MANDISMAELSRQIGLEELADLRAEDAAEFMAAAVVGLADGDFVVTHEPYSGRQAELYGENKLNDGLIAKAVARTAIENGMNPGPIYDFQGFAATLATDPRSQFASVKTVSSIRIHPEAVTIDGNPLALSQPPKLILDYGACLTGRSYIEDQMRFLNQGRQPFTYAPLTRTHFMNGSLIKTYDVNYGPGTASAFIRNQLYIGREDGTAGATGEIIKGQQSHGRPTEVADIILCTGAQHASAKDLQKGITNAHTLLREGGMLVVRSLARPASDEIGTEKITAWAFEAGFDERNALHYEAALEQMGTLLLSGHFGDREIQTVVLTK